MRTRLAVLVLAALLAAPTAVLAVSLPGIDPPTTPVRIERDAYGVPHVYAPDEYGLFWGNGYAQAQDRLFQMDVLRHVGKGESASILGPAQLSMDLATRRELYTQEERDALWATLQEEDPRSAAMFQAFADGVNAWIAKTRAEPALLSAEFYAIAHPPEDWTPQDTLAIAQFLLDIFGAGSGGNELDNAQVLWQLKAELGDAAAEGAFNDLFWLQDETTYTTIDPAEWAYAPTEATLAFDDISASQWAVIQAAANATPFAGGKSLAQAAAEAGLPSKLGSNAYVISSDLSASGKPMLFGGPQMAYHNPMIPYEVALHGAGFDALGMGVGGAPGVIIGRTPHYAWTVTSGSSDQVDVVAYKIADWDARTYHLAGTSGPTGEMGCRTETHYGVPTAIDQSPPVLAVQEVCRVGDSPVFAVNLDAGYVFVSERTHRLDEVRSGLLWLTFARSQSIEDIQDHMESFCFEFNFHVADDAGNIAYLHFGCNPDRSPDCDPRLPRLAGECDWEDVRSGRELPHIVNPAKGYIVNWNNKPAQGWSSGDAREKWGPVHRATLIEKALGGKLQESPTLTIDDLKEVNEYISTRSPFPPYFVPAISAANLGTTDPVVAAAASALVDWAATGYGWDDANADGKYDSPGFAIYETWRGVAQEMAFRDELGRHTRTMGFDPPLTSDPHAADHGREDNKDNVLHNAITGRTTHAWCADGGAIATCDDLLRESFEEAVTLLAVKHNTTDVSKWNQPVRQIKFVALSGGPAWLIPMVNRPSFNHYYDFGTGEAGSVLPPGTDQYWNPLPYLRYRADGTMDAHKRDQLDLYVAFEYKPAQMTPIAVESSETHHLRVR